MYVNCLYYLLLKGVQDIMHSYRDDHIEIGTEINFKQMRGKDQWKLNYHKYEN